MAENPYYRICSPSQTDEDIKKQIESREVWGKAPRNYNQSNIPKVKAYSKKPKGRNIRGIKFWTDIPPDPGGIPGQPTWSGGTEGVRIEGDYAKIKVTKIILFTSDD